jgi:hypothetical protein
LLANAVLRADTDARRQVAALELAAEVERLEGSLLGFAKEGRPSREFLALLRGAFEGFGLCAPEVWTAIMKAADELIAAAPAATPRLAPTTGPCADPAKDLAFIAGCGDERAAIYIYLCKRKKTHDHRDDVLAIADEIDRGEHRRRSVLGDAIKADRLMEREGVVAFLRAHGSTDDVLELAEQIEAGKHRG